MGDPRVLLGKGTSAVTMSADGADSFIQFGDKIIISAQIYNLTPF